MGAPDRPAGNGRLLTGVTWAVMLLGLWLWGKEAGGGFGGLSGPTTGDVAAVGRPFGASLPPAHDPLDGAAPERVEVPSVGIEAPVVARGLERIEGLSQGRALGELVAARRRQRGFRPGLG